MSTTATNICDLGQKAIDFDLTGIDSKSYNLASAKGEKGMLMVFICNKNYFTSMILTSYQTLLFMWMILVVNVFQYTNKLDGNSFNT